MQYIFIGVILVFLLYAIFSAKSQLIEDNEKKAFTSVTGLMSIAILFSILLSVIIALNADMPADIGYGGFEYIFGPGIFGILILILYLIAVGVKPNLKFIIGIISALINLGIGFFYFFN